MFNNTFNNLKEIGKKGVGFLKAVFVDTFTSLRDDFREERELRKEVKALREAKKASESSEKSE